MTAWTKTKVAHSTPVLWSKTRKLFLVFFVVLPPIKENGSGTNVLQTNLVERGIV
jgi:hypothetical protein